MGNSKSKKVQKEPDKFFERARWKEQRNEEKKKRNANPVNKRTAVKDPPVSPTAALNGPTLGNSPLPASSHVRSYDEEALDRMRYQLNHDSDAFLLNNILLSVQFLENYEREVQAIKSNPISERQHIMDEAMVRRHKHVFFGDRLQECVQDYVCYTKNRDHLEPLAPPRLYIIYDNVEASEPGDTSDYCAVLDAPFYKLGIEDSKEPGYVKLKKLEVLESSLSKEADSINTKNIPSDDSIYTDSEKESNASDTMPYPRKVRELKEKMQVRLNTELDIANGSPFSDEDLNNKISRKSLLTSTNLEQQQSEVNKSINLTIQESKARKSILKNANDSKSNTENHIAAFENLQIFDDTETSGYRSNSSRQTESSETESDYGYSTITDLTTPKKVELSLRSKDSASTGVLPDECWLTINEKTFDWSDDDEEEEVETASKISLNRNLYETHHYLNSVAFMNNFVDNFIISLGSGLGFPQDSINNALTQGASVYCSSLRNGLKTCYEIYPALLAAWPNAANQWIIRERKIIQNPRTNFSYQWPTKYMVSKALGFGCLLVPVGFRPKRGLNPDQKLQWRVIFPAAERYLESCLAHSHMRCYLFMLTLHKAFMENETSKIGVDASHIKNHLFWQCEDNYAKWPEDRLGETLRLFLRSFYTHFGRSRLPNYFIENCNEFKSVPKPLLLKVQRKLADILEAPVMHLLYALNKIKYIKKDFYPAFDCQRLYHILTCKNPLRIINPQLPLNMNPSSYSSDSEDENIQNIWDKAKIHDKHYQWKKERQRQIKERRRANLVNKKSGKVSGKENVHTEINKTIILPTKMETERRRLVFEFFIPHFIAMARSSEKFDAIRQAVIYLEQARRLCILLRGEPAGEATANEYIHVIRDKLADCQRKLANQVGYKVSVREKRNHERSVHSNVMRKHRPKYEHIINQDSPTYNSGIAPFTFVDIHVDSSANQDVKSFVEIEGLEESKL
ncbi:uncharacterized protein LOC123691095 [Colias croceus]|uniref:uncharacterized protein LOC123691095 n=1 Tax=Colias crocea TaxID=72248 RepID=UPI001E27E9DC|nr:uncharacterized protein LOC123691095 [Colias croceus]